MEETRKKFPLLPLNYVSLQQLREQRLRELEQRQREEEEEKKQEEQKLKEEEEDERRKKKEEERKLRESRKNLGTRDKTSSNRINRKDRGNVPVECDRRKEKEKTDSKLKNQESEIVEAVEGGNTDLGQKLEKVRKKRWRKRYGKKARKSNESEADEAGDGGIDELPPSESNKNEVILMHSSVAKKQAAASPEKAKETNPTTAEVVERSAVLSVADDKQGAEKYGDKRVNCNRSAVSVNPGSRSIRRKSSVKQKAEVAQKTKNQTSELVARIAVLSVANDHKAVETDGDKETDGNRSVAVANPGSHLSRRKSSVKQTERVRRRMENPKVACDLKLLETGVEKEVNGNESTFSRNALRGGCTGRKEYWGARRFGYRSNIGYANLVWVKKEENDNKHTLKEADRYPVSR